MSTPHTERPEGATVDNGLPLESDEALRASEEMAAWQELRAVLLGPERRDLEEVRQLLVVLQDRKQRLRQVSEVLPEALAHRASEDEALSDALGPTIEETLRRSVARDPSALADALFPVIAPAIRKSLREALNAILVSVNQALEYSLSPRSIRWRLEARRTGVTFATIVLRYTLLYRVEQVLLIDRNTGLLLHHVLAEDIVTQNSDLVSGMLTAIQEFAKDSFGTDEADTLDSFQVGELTVWMVPGPKALVAAVLRGVPDPALRETFYGINEEIHLRFGEELSSPDREEQGLERSHAVLQKGLLTQYREQEAPGKISRTFWVVLALVVMGLGYLTFQHLQERHRWQEYLTLLEAESGIIVLESGKENGQRFVYGLRDPLATDPASLLSGAEIPAEKVDARWEPYQALDSALIIQRSARLLQLPEGVRLRLNGGELIASGAASASWIAFAAERARFIAGIESFNGSELLNETEELFRSEMSRLEQLSLRFHSGTARLLEGQERMLDAMGTTLLSLLQTAEEAKISVRIQVRGHASRDGSQAINDRLSQQRADRIVSLMADRGVPTSAMEAIGTGRPLVEEVTDETTREINQSISFKVVLVES